MLTAGLASALATTAGLASAAVPAALTEQGRLFDGTGAPLGGTVSVTFTIHDAPAGGNALWSETQSLTLDAGYFSAQLGAVTPVPAGVWDGSVRYVGIQVGTDAEMTPREATRSVPYALVAGDATGDIHPTTVSVNGHLVIDAQGNWVGPATGLVGPMGPAGAAGAQGPAGPAGATGAPGPAGPAGANGTNGAAGPTGAQGPVGPQGAVGAIGATGPQGPAGASGVNGSNGATGALGPTGPQGQAGATGPAGGGGGAASTKAWVNFNGTAAACTPNCTIRASYNVASVRRITTGAYTVTFATAMTDANYVVTGDTRMPTNSYGGATLRLFSYSPDGSSSYVSALPTTTSFSFGTLVEGYTNGTDVDYGTLAIFGN
jgi:hypothetical protein